MAWHGSWIIRIHTLARRWRTLTALFSQTMEGCFQHRSFERFVQPLMLSTRLRCLLASDRRRSDDRVGRFALEVPGVEKDAPVCRCWVHGDNVGTGENLNVSCATADLDLPPDEREREGVGPPLERDRAIGADTTCDGNVEGLRCCSAPQL